MAKSAVKPTLTAVEKSVIKALALEGWRNQDILTLINNGRSSSVNFGRISGVKNSDTITPASSIEVDLFKRKKLLFDHVTGLCRFDDERLVRSREAMILAVELFNTPRIGFKAGVFAMLSNVAWTYLMHQYYLEKGVSIYAADGFTVSLSYVLKRPDCPLSKPCCQNLNALKEIRDVVEHRTIGPFDSKWLPLFQSTCLNYEKYLTQFFGSRLTLGNELGFALQFAKLSTDEIASLQSSELPEHIASLDASLAEKLGEGDIDNVEYQFKVVYTLTSASKSKAHFQFIQPESAEGKEIQNVLIKYKSSDELYPYRSSDVTKLVAERSGRKFTSDKHQRAWKKFKARPPNGAKIPSNTKEEFCRYNSIFNSYTYSNAWVDFLVEHINDDAAWKSLISFK